MNDRGIKASSLLSPLPEITNPENTTQFKLVKDSSSNRVNELLIHNSIPVTSDDNLLTFRDSNETLESKGDPLKMITNKNYNVDHASLLDKKIMYDFAKESYFDVRAPGKKSTRDKTLIKLLKSPGLVVPASGVPNAISLPSDSDEHCDRLKLLMQVVQAGKISDQIKNENFVILAKFLEYKCISKIQHKQILIKINLLHK